MSITVAGVVRNGVVVPSAPLPEGAQVTVSVVMAEELEPKFGSVLEFLESLPPRPSPRCFPTWEEYEQHLREEKDAWER